MSLKSAARSLTLKTRFAPDGTVSSVVVEISSASGLRTNTIGSGGETISFYLRSSSSITGKGLFNSKCSTRCAREFPIPEIRIRG